MDIVELKDKLSEINQRGYIVSLRGGNTGVGYTLETLLGLEENNFKTPDFGDVELKSQRNGVSTPVTMFTLDRQAWKITQKKLIETYGYIDKNGRQSLYCTVNSKPNNQGLFVKVEGDAFRIYHEDGSFIAEWIGARLIDVFTKKMPALVIVNADTQTNSDGKEEFWYKESYLLTEPDEDNFLELIKEDIIIVDVRMHLKVNGSVRNHGTAFRIDERFWNRCFGRREQLI
jgi:hypothetical protein